MTQSAPATPPTGVATPLAGFTVKRVEPAQLVLTMKTSPVTGSVDIPVKMSPGGGTRGPMGLNVPSIW
ncbi:MAG: hypothetical protein OES32_19510 [Acidobacteriota bacterium]|nr:hypothetical protein [Acidobacteriota bacterium]